MTTNAIRATTNARWVNPAIIVGSVMFVLGLTVSAIFDAQWRTLHVFQALIYVAVVLLTRRQSAWGFGAGTAIAVFWNTWILFLSPIGRSIARGEIRPDIVISLTALSGHLLIIAGCLAGFLRTGPDGRQWAQFTAGGILAIGYFIVIIFLVGPPVAIEHLKQAFGL